MSSVISSHTQPVRYDASVEQIEEDERETTAELVATLRSIIEKTCAHSGHAIRSVHAKSHGLMQGELHVLDGLPAELAQGMFARPAHYPVIMRLSTVPGDMLPDSVSTPRGLALKVVGVEGERLPGSEDAVTQDFVMVNGPAFTVPSIKKFLKNMKLLAATTDKVPGLKKVLSATLRGLETVVEAFGGESSTLKSMGGHPETHILGETFFSQAPLRYGAYIAKVSVAPVSRELTALTDAPLDVNDKPDGLREAVVDFFRDKSGEWEMRVQLCTDLETMPVEDSSVVWPEDESPYIAVARISVPPQVAWSEARATAVDDGLFFSPWHGLVAHQPLGSIMRARKPAYAMSARFRSELNQQSIEEPRADVSLPT